jgi:hypothetical protein
VAKNYDASLLDRESLERLMTRELMENLKIDLIFEEGGHEFDILPSPYLNKISPKFNTSALILSKTIAHVSATS